MSIDHSQWPVLSVKQPWAWLILGGQKDVENRGWRTNYRGRLFIHASAEIDNNYGNGLYYLCGRAEAAKRDFPYKVAADLPRAFVRDLPRGGIIGAVTLVDIAATSPSPWWDGIGLAWVLAEPESLNLIPCKGRQRLFRLGGGARNDNQ